MKPHPRTFQPTPSAGAAPRTFCLARRRQADGALDSIRSNEITSSRRRRIDRRVTEVLLATRRLVFAVDVGRETPPSLRRPSQGGSRKKPISANLKAAFAARRILSSSTSVHFVEAVLQWPIAGRRAMHLAGADQAAISRRREKHSKRASSACDVHQESATTSRRTSLRSGAPRSRCSRSQFKGGDGNNDFRRARRVERSSSITSAHRGDGVAFATGRRVRAINALAGEDRSRLPSTGPSAAGSLLQSSVQDRA